jgi:pimeloyl-ACP methyl ester carboxylesterase
LSATALEAQVQVLDWKPAPSRTYDGREIIAESARLSVPESRAAPGRTIAVGLIRLKSTAATPGDPTVFLMGGPGIPASVMLPIPPYFDLFDRLRTQGDVILVDQRGIGTSDPVLSCPAKGSLPTDFLATHTSILNALRDVTSACLEEWRGKGVRVAAYNTQESADDLESLRQALGVPRLNLLAFSYGTHVALSFVRRHPDRVGRLVLQGVRGPDQSLKGPAAYERGFTRLAELAPRSSVSGASLSMAETLLLLARQPPIEVAVTDRGGRPDTLVIGGQGLQVLVSNAPDDPRMPAMLGSLANHDSTILAAMAASAWQGLGEVNLMARAVDCASASSETAELRVVQETFDGALLGNPAPNLVRTREFCSLFGDDIRLPDDFRRPVTSRAPALFISGELDLQAPADSAASVAKGFARSTVLVVKNGRHELLTIPAVQGTVSDFFAGKDVAGRELSAEPPRWLSVEEAKAPPRRR